MRILVTGATGKVGLHALDSLRKDARFAGASLVALCHNRDLPNGDGIEMIKGSINDKDDVARALEGVTHVLHLAAVKESPDLAIDVSVKGMFLLMEEFRASPTAERFVLLGGDCSVGHVFHDYTTPITESSPRRAYQGCYALTKVVEEVMLEQYVIQYGIDATCVRVPWIMEKDDFRFALSFDEDQFGGPAWDELMPAADLERARSCNMVPLMLAHDGAPLQRNFIHVDDVVSALLAALLHPDACGETFNVAMDLPVDYGRLAELVGEKTNAEAITIQTPFFSNWLDNRKARKVLGWAPEVDLEALIERAWGYRRAANEARKIWYPG